MNNKNQKDKIRSVLFAIQAANAPLKMRDLRIGANLQKAIKSTGVISKIGDAVIWNKGRHITERLVDQIFEHSFKLGMKYREQAKKKAEQEFKLFAESVNKPVGTITDIKEDAKGIQIEFEQTPKASKRLEIAVLLRQIADILER